MALEMARSEGGKLGTVPPGQGPALLGRGIGMQNLCPPTSLSWEAVGELGLGRGCPCPLHPERCAAQES